MSVIILLDMTREQALESLERMAVEPTRALQMFLGGRMSKFGGILLLPGNVEVFKNRYGYMTKHGNFMHVNDLPEVSIPVDMYDRSELQRLHEGDRIVIDANEPGGDFYPKIMMTLMFDQGQKAMCGRHN